MDLKDNQIIVIDSTRVSFPLPAIPSMYSLTFWEIHLFCFVAENYMGTSNPLSCLSVKYEYMCATVLKIMNII